MKAVTIIGATAKTWLDAVNFVSCNTPSKASLECQSCVHIIADEGNVNIAYGGTDGICAVRPLAGALMGDYKDAERERIVCAVNAAAFKALLSSLDADEEPKIALINDDASAPLVEVFGQMAYAAQSLVCVHTMGKLSLKCCTPFCFEPYAVDESKAKWSFTIHAKDLKDAFKKTRWAMAADEVRVVMNGVCIRENNDKLDFCSTDGRKLTILNTNIDALANASIIVPPAMINFVMQISTNCEVHIFSCVDDYNTQYVLCVSSAGRCYCQAIEGTYPNVYAVIPKEPATTLQIKRSTMLSAIKRLKVTEDGSDVVTFIEDAEQGLMMSRRVDMWTRAEERITAVIEGDKSNCLPFALSLSILREALNVNTADTIALNICSFERPIWTCADNMTILMMPCRVPGEYKKDEELDDILADDNNKPQETAEPIEEEDAAEVEEETADAA